MDKREREMILSVSESKSLHFLGYFPVKSFSLERPSPKVECRGWEEGRERERERCQAIQVTIFFYIRFNSLRRINQTIIVFQDGLSLARVEIEIKKKH